MRFLAHCSRKHAHNFVLQKLEPMPSILYSSSLVVLFFVRLAKETNTCIDISESNSVRFKHSYDKNEGHASTHKQTINRKLMQMKCENYYLWHSFSKC